MRAIAGRALVHLDAVQSVNKRFTGVIPYVKVHQILKYVVEMIASHNQVESAAYLDEDSHCHLNWTSIVLNRVASDHQHRNQNGCGSRCGWRSSDEFGWGQKSSDEF